jgi:hypothetical protein
MGRGVCYIHGLLGLIMHLYDVRCGAESAIYMASLAGRAPSRCQMWRGVRYLHGPVGFTTHLYDVR